MSISPKERFLDICHFKRPNDLCLLTTSGNVFWEETLQEWVKQGAPEQILKARFRGDSFQFQHIRWLLEIRSGYIGADVRTNTNIGHGILVNEGTLPFVPAFTPRVIAENERTITYVDGTGQTVKAFLDDPHKMPTFLDWPVKDRATWKEVQKRLDPVTADRWPSEWSSYVQRTNSRPEPISLEIGGFYGYLREMIGSERILYMFYDDPNLIEDMMEQMLYLESEVVKRTLKDIKVQQVSLWEDMCWKGGSMISPAMVKKFMMPRYKKLVDLVRSYGVDVIFLDSDGKLDELIPIWLECGINFLWPLEVAAGNDAVAIRKKYGKDLIIGGTIDKRALIKGKEAIREEVMSKVPFLLEQGGYFPSVDHMVPPDVPWENYVYFINIMREVAGLRKLSI